MESFGLIGMPTLNRFEFGFRFFHCFGGDKAGTLYSLKMSLKKASEYSVESRGSSPAKVYSVICYYRRALQYE